MLKTLYKSSHMIAIVILAGSFTLAGAAYALSHSATSDTLLTAPLLDRFVVSTHNVRFISAAPSAAVNPAR